MRPGRCPASSPWSGRRAPLVAVHHVLVGRRAELPRRADRLRVGVPAVVINASVAEHLEVLGPVCGGRIGVGLVPRVGHAHALNRLLGDTVDHKGLREAGRLEDGRRRC